MEGVFIGNLSPIKISRNNTKVGYLRNNCRMVPKQLDVPLKAKLRSQVEEVKEGLCGVALTSVVKRSRGIKHVDVKPNKYNQFTKRLKI